MAMVLKETKSSCYSEKALLRHSKKPKGLPLDLVILSEAKNPGFYCCFVGFLDWILRSLHFLRMTVGDTEKTAG